MNTKHLNCSFTNPNYKNPTEGLPKYVTVKDVKYTQLREWQQECFQTLLSGNQLHRFAVVQAFCGSGKSFAQVALATHDITSTNYTQKQLIVVPQEHISQGFIGKDDNQFICLNLNNQNYQWKILAHNNFCDGENRTQNLKNWLLNKKKTNFQENLISGLNAVCSSAALAIVWQSFTEKQKQQAIKNLTLRIDEAHHIKNVFLDQEDYTQNQKERIEKESTELGRICTYIINNKEQTSKIHLTTATMYRGDRSTILSKEVANKFKSYSLDWTRHFNTLGIENFNFQYEEYKENPIDQIVKQIKKEKKEKHYIVIPAKDAKWRKENSLQELIKKLETIYPKERILDLVSEQTQQKNKELLLQEPKEDGTNSKFDVVIVCRLGREGTDWCPCSRIHNAYVEQSVTLAIQTLGRLFRKWHNKTIVKAFHYTEKLHKPQDVTTREMLSDRTNAILVVMRLNDIFHPLIAPTEIPDTEIGTGTYSNTLETVFGTQYENAQKDMIEGFELLKTKNKESITNLAKQICEDYGVDEKHTDAVVAKIVRMASKDLRFKNIDIAWVRENGFDKVEFYESLYYGAELTGLDYEAIANVLRGRGKEFATYPEAQKIVQEAGVKSSIEYREWKDRPDNLPSNPDKIYFDKGWTNWFDFLQFGRKVGKIFCSYEEAVLIAKKNNISTSIEYQNWKDRPNNMPSRPEDTYKYKGWTNWFDFLETKKIFVSYQEARKIVQTEKIKSISQYQGWKDRPKNMPSNPRSFYRNKGWTNWFDFLGNKNITIDYVSFIEAKDIVIKNNIKTPKEYKKWDNRPTNLPLSPHSFYRNKGWTTWRDFLKSGRRVGTSFCSIKCASDIAIKNNIKTSKEYANWKDRPIEIPSNPSVKYRNKGWTTWRDFLATEFAYYQEARKIVQTEKIKSASQYQGWKDRPSNLPVKPDITYQGKGWISWYHFLGKE